MNKTNWPKEGGSSILKVLQHQLPMEIVKFNKNIKKIKDKFGFFLTIFAKVNMQLARRAVQWTT